MLGPVRGVGEGLVAALVLAHVRLLTRVGPQVGLQVLQTGIGLGAAFELQRRETSGLETTLSHNSSAIPETAPHSILF